MSLVHIIKNIYMERREKMKRKKMFILLAALTVLAVGCGAESGDGTVEETLTGTSEDEDSPEALAADYVEEEKPAEAGNEGGVEDTAEEDVGTLDNPVDAYSDILDRFYYQILGGWNQTEDISYMFSWDYTSVHSLSDAGYMLTDLNGDGMEELLVSPAVDAADGLIYDLYACVNGEVVHAASSGERYRYNYCKDGTIYYEGSSGAGNSTFAGNEVTEDGTLRLKEVVRYDESQDKEKPWFYSTDSLCYDGKNGFDYSRMSGISEEEAQGIIDSYEVSPLELTLFDGYTPKEDMPMDMSLRAAYQSAIGSETDLFFECDDYDGDGTKEAFGVTGVDTSYDIEDFRLYYIAPDGQVSCEATLDMLYGFGGMEPAGVIDTGSAKFIVFGGACGQETWLYGIRDGKVYQPEVSGQHSDFIQRDGEYFAMPHEGGEGFYMIFFDFDPVTGEFVEREAEQ